MSREATGMQRADTEIFAEARRVLDQTVNVPATVRVHIDEGTAWLTGVARSASQRVEAERAVLGVAGVRGVVNKIVVTQAPRVSDLEDDLE